MSSEPGSAIGELIDAAAERLRAARVVKPRREANRLWAWQIRTSAGRGYLDRDTVANARMREQYERAVARRIAGEPMAYVLGSAGFRNLELRADRRALIPRPETELLVDHALSHVRTGRALDVCTGSGCLALALAQEGRFSAVVASDISREALELARENARETELAIHLVRSDLGAAFAPGSFDLMVANPPYLTRAELAALDPQVAAWEPHQALVSGPTGLECTAVLLSQAADLLVPGGWVVMELDSTRSGAAAVLARSAGLLDVTVLDDLFGRPRYLTGRRGHEA